MELIEYVKSQLPNTPNTQIMYDLGASDELIEYIKQTPENTNFNIVGTNFQSTDGWTFIFKPQEITYQEKNFSIFASSEVNKFKDMLNSISDGKILQVSNLEGTITIKELEESLSIDLPFDYYGEGAQPTADSLIFFDGSMFLEVTDSINMEVDGFIVIMLEGDADSGQLEFSATLIDGYKITIQGEFGSSVYFVPVGESWTCVDNRLSDGTNEYNKGDIITPTSDMILSYIVQ